MEKASSIINELDHACWMGREASAVGTARDGPLLPLDGTWRLTWTCRGSSWQEQSAPRRSWKWISKSWSKSKTWWKRTTGCSSMRVWRLSKATWLLSKPTSPWVWADEESNSVASGHLLLKAGQQACLSASSQVYSGNGLSWAQGNLAREREMSLQPREGDFASYFLTYGVTFTLPANIEDWPPTVQEKLFDWIIFIQQLLTPWYSGSRDKNGKKKWH